MTTAPRPPRRAGAYRRAGEDPLYRRRLVGQGRRRKIDNRRQSRARPRGAGLARRPARRRHLRPFRAAPVRPHGKPEVVDGKMIPLEAYGVKIMSIGFLVDEDVPMVWRGPMVAQALDADARRGRLGRARRARRRHAAGHRRRAS